MRSIILSSLCLFAIGTASGSVLYRVSLDTTPLVGHAAGPFSLAFQYSDGSGTGDGNNAAMLSDFQFGGGGGVGLPTLLGSASGDLSGGVLLTDATPSSFFLQTFTPGSVLGFSLQLSTNVDAGLVPDAFAFSILDQTFMPIPTTAGFPLDVLMIVTMEGTEPTVQLFQGDPTRSPFAGGAPIALAAPQVLVPEPGSFGLVGVILSLLPLARWRGCGRRR